jgi:hypothetical protein
MPITEKQRERRRNWIGSSDMPAVMEVDPWKSGEEVRLEKLGRLEPKEANEAMEIGNLYERPLLKWASRKLGKLLINPQNVSRTIAELHLMSNLDAVVASNKDPVESKIVGIVNPMFRGEEWGDNGSDMVPERVIVQAHVHMMTVDASVCHVPALIAGRGHCLFHVHRERKLCDLIAEYAKRFWECVVSDTQWSGRGLTLEVFKRLKRTPASIVNISPDAVQKWLEAKHTLTMAAANETFAKARVLAEIGPAEAGDYGDDESVVTYLECHRAGYVVGPTTFRTLRTTSRKNILGYTPINMPQLTEGPADERQPDGLRDCEGGEPSGSGGTESV